MTNPPPSDARNIAQGWIECTSEDDFADLPPHLQRALIQVAAGYLDHKKVHVVREASTKAVES